MTEKPKEKIYAERFDASKKDREKISKAAIQEHKEDHPQPPNKKFKFKKKNTQ